MACNSCLFAYATDCCLIEQPAVVHWFDQLWKLRSGRQNEEDSSPEYSCLRQLNVVLGGKTLLRLFGGVPVVSRMTQWVILLAHHPTPSTPSITTQRFILVSGNGSKTADEKQ